MSVQSVAKAPRIAACLAAAALAACAGAAGPGDRSDDPVLDRLAGDFYERISNRRFNSIATYRDPALREFFRTTQAWSDYYANLVQALDDAHFEAIRPTRIQLLAIARAGPEQVIVSVRFTGENGLPLRWWRTRIVREDQWEREDGRWWIVPGKL